MLKQTLGSVFIIFFYSIRKWNCLQICRKERMPLFYYYFKSKSNDKSLQMEIILDEAFFSEMVELWEKKIKTFVFVIFLENYWEFLNVHLVFNFLYVVELLNTWNNSLLSNKLSLKKKNFTLNSSISDALKLLLLHFFSELFMSIIRF